MADIILIPFWVTLSDLDGPMHGVCVEAVDEAEARKTVEYYVTSCTFGTSIEKIQTLPYPANPRLTKSDTPTFCRYPYKCAGHGSCPSDPACTE